MPLARRKHDGDTGHNRYDNRRPQGSNRVHATDQSNNGVFGFFINKAEDKADEGRKRIEEERKKIEEERERTRKEDLKNQEQDALRNGRKQTSPTASEKRSSTAPAATNTPTAVLTKLPQEANTRSAIKQIPTTTSQAQENPNTQIVVDGFETGTNGVPSSSIITSYTTQGTNAPEPPVAPDLTIPTAAPTHTLNAGQIAAIVISSVGLAILLLSAVFLFLRFRRHQQHPGASAHSLSKPDLPPQNHHHHPYSQLLSAPLPPETTNALPEVSKPRPTISRWLSQVRAESHPHLPNHPPSISLPSFSSHSGSQARARGQPDMVSDISSQISGFTYPTVTVSSGGRSFRPPTQLRPPTGSSMGSSGRDVKGMKPVHPSIYISPATASNSTGSVNSQGLLGGFPLPPGRLMEEIQVGGEEVVSPVSLGLGTGLGTGVGNGARLSGLGVGRGYEEAGEYSEDRRGSWEVDERLGVLEGNRGSV
ncbi:hypothetical protein QC761_0048050 [Podospora bellae-mahoneyi]|uniref:Uncharacterized protein n=1 Tax=Podospora bellae-mahoneyi TaxID=2093777 RepID=A0ABR0FJ68_9PEZI|nr:hypothetical protein QC761_0048050 [Podospora bellae-mahoneyi]